MRVSISRWVSVGCVAVWVGVGWCWVAGEWLDGWGAREVCEIDDTNWCVRLRDATVVPDSRTIAGVAVARECVDRPATDLSGITIRLQTTSESKRHPIQNPNDIA